MGALQRTPSLMFLLLAAPLYVAGCGSGEGEELGGAPSGPTLVVLDSVLLAESDTVYIGKPGEPSVDRYDGSFYVPDFFSNQVYRFARDGRLLKVYGGPGQGPGEFRSVAAAFVTDDSTVMVVDRGNEKLVIFGRKTARLRNELQIAGFPAQAVPLVIGDSVWMHVAIVGKSGNLVRFSLLDQSEAVNRVGRPPGSFLASLDQGGTYAGFYGSGGFLAAMEGLILHGYPPLNWLYVRRHDGTIVDSVYVPAVRRRGIPSDLQERVDSEGVNLLDIMESHSALFGIHVMPDGKVAVEYQDWTLLSRDVVPPPTSAKVWVALLSANLEQACVDAKLSYSRDAKPMAAFRGDTIFQLERRIVGEGRSPDELRAEAWLRIVRIDDEGCDWIPARPSPATIG